MAVFIARRFASLVPLLLAVAFVAFIVLQLSPGDPARLMLGENASAAGIRLLHQKLGLDRPLAVQFALFLRNAALGDLGRSFSTSRPVLRELAPHLNATLRLSTLSFGLSVILGIPLGVLSAIKRNSWVDYLARLVVLVFVSVPVFWLGILLIYLFAVKLHWLPSAGSATPAHLVLPAVALCTYTLGVLVRMTRGSMLEALRQDFLRTAYAKGLRGSTVVWRHALRNALIPIVTVMGLQFGSLMSGAVVTETVFGWPGIGKYMIDAVFARDYPVIRGCILTFALGFLFVNLAVDVLYVKFDPRISY